jgi:predicted nucleic acid-binding protein
MRALDTPVLLDLLRGAPSARAVLRASGAEEVATTEVNLWELGRLASADGGAGRDRRLAALDRLRRKLLVFPVDASTVVAAGRSRDARFDRLSPISELILRTVENHGCTEWVTTREVARPGRLGPRLTAVEYRPKHS